MLRSLMFANLAILALSAIAAAWANHLAATCGITCGPVADAHQLRGLALAVLLGSAIALPLLALGGQFLSVRSQTA